jgi:hypothetical protein
MRSFPALAAALLLVVAGCGGVAGPDGTPSANTTPTPTATDSKPTATPTAATPAPHGDFVDPSTDRLGWEAGRWYDEPLSVNASDGLNRSERAAVVARTMARVERLRGLEFESSVPVAVVDRETYLNREEVNATVFDEVLWEALLLVGEDRSVEAVFESFYGTSVQGSYAPNEDRIVVVGDGERPTIDRRTLAHELVHALQNQHFGIERATLTRDERLARQGLLEGDAGYVEDLYERRCRSNWSCVPRPRGPGASLDGNMGVYVAAYQPYSDGPAFVHRLRQRGGWAAVNAAYANPPTSSAQVIHPGRYPNWSAERVRIADRSAGNWSRLNRTPPGTTVGEASLFTTMWANGAVETFHLQRPSRPHRAYNYTHSATAGWVGDRIVPYRSGDGRTGYVFRTKWATEGDAAEFAIAYRRLVRERRGAERREGDVLVVPAGPYADAFRVTREGRTVTVVNAPTVETLDAVHAG